MDIRKRDIVDLEGVYSTLTIKLGEKLYYAVASEVKGKGSYIIDSETYEYSPLWGDEVSGVMNLIQIPEKEEILAITKFYPVFQAKESEIVLLKPTGNNFISPWEKISLFTLPYCHRIGAIKNKNGVFFICCTLCQDKEYEQDWRFPGSVYIVKEGSWRINKIYENLTRNHGLFIEGTDAYVAADEGVLKFPLSSYDEGDCVNVEKLSSRATSDISVSRNIVATIEPFHGNSAILYDRSFNVKSKFDMDFGHVVWVGDINKKPSLILGNRGKEKELILIDINSGDRTVIDSGVGPTQISVVNEDGNTLILSANHGVGKVTIYEIL